MGQSPDFDELVTRFYEPLYQFAFSLTRAEQDACDLTQETFYVWATKGHQLRDPSKVKTWLFTTMHRQYLQQRRRSTRFPQVDVQEAESQHSAEPVTPKWNLDASAVLHALSEVDGSYRAPVALFYLQDFSYQEIAEILKVPLGTVKSRISRGIGQLRDLLRADLKIDADKEK